jgi:hypothetical protein
MAFLDDIFRRRPVKNNGHGKRLGRNQVILFRLACYQIPSDWKPRRPFAVNSNARVP